MKIEFRFLTLILFLALNVSAFETSGSLKFRDQVYGPNVKGAQKSLTSQEFITTARMNVKKKLIDSITFNFAYDFSIVNRYINDLSIHETKESSSFKYRAFDLNLNKNETSTRNTLTFKQNLDRFFITHSTDIYDFNFGRQAVSFGSGRFVNPTDVLVPFPVTRIDKEEREGVDAMRLKIPVSHMGEIDVGLVFGDKAKNETNAYYINGRYPIFEWDSSFMIMEFRENILLGVDIQGEIKGVGIWLETAYTFSEESNEYLRASFGLEFNFPWDVYTFLEYHYNGAGVKNSDEYVINSMTAPYVDGGVFLLGRDYLTHSLSYNFTPLIVLSEKMMFNMNDYSILFSPKIDWNITENSYLGFGLFLGFGKKSDCICALKSEFGAYSDSAYISYRYYF